MITLSLLLLLIIQIVNCYNLFLYNNEICFPEWRTGLIYDIIIEFTVVATTYLLLVVAALLLVVVVVVGWLLSK